MSNILDTLKSISSAMAEKASYESLLKQTQETLDANLNSILQSHKEGLVDFPFIYRDLLVDCDSVGSITVKKVTTLEDPTDTPNDEPKEWQLWSSDRELCIVNTRLLTWSRFVKL